MEELFRGIVQSELERFYQAHFSQNPKEKEQADKSPDPYTIAALMSHLHKSRTCIYKWISQGLLHPTKVGGAVFFDPAEVNALVSNKRLTINEE